MQVNDMAGIRHASLCNYALPSCLTFFCVSEMTPWTEEECRSFEEGGYVMRIGICMVSQCVQIEGGLHHEVRVYGIYTTKGRGSVNHVIVSSFSFPLSLFLSVCIPVSTSSFPLTS